MAVEIITGDCREALRRLADKSVHTCVTSPPYFGLRDYGVDGQMGLEHTPDEFVAGMVEVFREVRRVLMDDGTLWLNLGDSYAGSGRGGYMGGKSGLDGSTTGQDNSRAAKISQLPAALPPGLKQKDLIGIPWMVAFALRADGWYLRKDVIWHKLNPMPESVTDRPTGAHEYLFLMSKSPRYYYDAEAITEEVSENTHARIPGPNSRVNVDRVPESRKLAPSGGGIKSNQSFYEATAGHVERRNKRSVWSVATQPFKEAHFATFPPDLIEPCILAGCPKGGTVLDPFGGAGTTGLVADRLGRNATLIELNPAYVEIARRRIEADAGMFAAVS